MDTDTYTSEEEYPLYWDDLEAMWPRPRQGAFPMIHLLPTASPMSQPQPLSVALLAEYEAYKASLKSAEEACETAEKEANKISEELGKMGVNRWNKSTGVQRRRLETDLVKAEAKKEEARANIQSMNDSGKILQSIVKLHSESVKSYAENEKIKSDIWQLNESAR